MKERQFIIMFKSKCFSPGGFRPITQQSVIILINVLLFEYIIFNNIYNVIQKNVSKILSEQLKQPNVRYSGCFFGFGV